jgi:hypothetical protein
LILEEKQNSELTWRCSLIFSEEEIVVWNSILEELKKKFHSVFIGFNELLFWFLKSIQMS